MERVSLIPPDVAGTVHAQAQSADQSGTSPHTAMENLFTYLARYLSPDEIEHLRTRIHADPSSLDVIEAWRGAHDELFRRDKPFSKSRSRRFLSIHWWVTPFTLLWRPFRLRKPVQQIYEESFVRVVDIELLDANRKRIGVESRAAAMIDIWTPHNLMSPRLAQRFFDLEGLSPEPLLKTLGGPANTLGSVLGRWFCIDRRRTAFPRLDDKFQDSRFFVMEEDIGYDIIIGREDIIGLDMLNLGTRLPSAYANGFRSQLPDVNYSTLTTDERQAQIARQEEEAQRRRDEEWRRRRDEGARNFAAERAQPMAQLYGSGSQEYRSTYIREFEEYVRAHPRP